MHTVSTDDVLFRCAYCPYSSASRQSCNLHMHKKHGWLPECHYLVQGTTCPICLKAFFTRARVLEHIQYKSKTCFYNLLLRGRVLSRGEAWALLENIRSIETPTARTGYRRARAVLPVAQAYGPRIPCLPVHLGHWQCGLVSWCFLCLRSQTDASSSLLCHVMSYILIYTYLHTHINRIKPEMLSARTWCQICIFANTYLCTCMYRCSNKDILICVYIYLYMYMHPWMYLYTNMYVNIYICKDT